MAAVLPGPEEGEILDYIELYLPKKLAHLSELYRYLRRRVGKEQTSLLFNGFSAYEVDGAFVGKRKRIWEERTLIVRILFLRPVEMPDMLV
jgi:hypothetical protein